MKKIIVFLLSLTICLTPSLTFASTAEKWVVEKVVYESVAKVVNVTAKRALPTVANNPSYLARVPVTSLATGSTVASMIRMGVAGAVIYGLVQGVGWVIENGVVKKPVDDGQIHTEYFWQSNVTWSDGAPVCKNPTKFSGGQSAISELTSCALGNGYKDLSCTMANFDSYTCKAINRYGYPVEGLKVVRVKNQSYDPNQTLVPVSDTELGDKINNSPQAPQILPDVYNPNNPAGGSAPNASSDALDNAPPIPGTDPTGGTKPKPNVDTNGDGIPDKYDPEKPSLGDELTLPEFCSWAVTVCEWYVKYKEDSKQAEAQRESEKVVWQTEEVQRQKELSFWEKVQDYMNWSREPPEKDDSDNDVPVKNPEAFDNSVFSKDRFAVSRQCPIPEQHTISLSGVSVNFSFDMTPLCQVLILARPALVACSYLYAAYIVIGAARNG